MAESDTNRLKKICVRVYSKRKSTNRVCDREVSLLIERDAKGASQKCVRGRPAVAAHARHPGLATGDNLRMRTQGEALSSSHARGRK